MAGPWCAASGASISRTGGPSPWRSWTTAARRPSRRPDRWPGGAPPGRPSARDSQTSRTGNRCCQAQQMLGAAGHVAVVDPRRRPPHSCQLSAWPGGGPAGVYAFPEARPPDATRPEEEDERSGAAFPRSRSPCGEPRPPRGSRSGREAGDGAMPPGGRREPIGPPLGTLREPPALGCGNTGWMDRRSLALTSTISYCSSAFLLASDPRRMASTMRRRRALTSSSVGTERPGGPRSRLRAAACAVGGRRAVRPRR